jgi:hypothetical protein
LQKIFPAALGCADRFDSKQLDAKRKRKFFRFTAKEGRFSRCFALSEISTFTCETKTTRCEKTEAKLFEAKNAAGSFATRNKNQLSNDNVDVIM